MTKHTPGPWVVGDKKNLNVIGSIPIHPGCTDRNAHAWASYCLPAQELNATPLERMESALANARLIAAAPDLLEACKKLVEGHQTLHPNPWQLEKCEYCDLGIKAILRAEGKESK